MPAIAAAHGIAYVATTSVAYPRDLAKKVQKGIAVRGPAYLQIHAPCNVGWGFDSAKNDRDRTTRRGNRLWMMYEIVDGELVNVMKVLVNSPLKSISSSRDDCSPFQDARGRSPNQINSRLREL